MLSETGSHRGLGGNTSAGESFADKDRMADILGLSYGEHLMVWTLRRLVSRRGLDPLTMKEFTDSCGAGAPQVLATFQGFLAIAGHASRRPISVGYPGFAGLTMDERHLVALVGSAQAGAADRVSAHLLFLSKPKTREDLGIAANVLAAIFDAHGLGFASPAPSPTAPRGHAMALVN